MISVLVLLIISVPVAIADEDEYEDKEDRVGFGIMEREREREHQDDENLAIGSDTGNLILYITIGAIIVSIGYTAFKMFRMKKRTVSKV